VHKHQQSNHQLEDSETNFKWCINLHIWNNSSKPQEPDELQNTK
jgi:hypothetical protein